VLEELKADMQTRDIPVIVLSVAHDKQKAMSLGASDCLEKPIDWERLFSSIKRQVRKEGLEAML